MLIKDATLKMQTAEFSKMKMVYLPCMTSSQSIDCVHSILLLKSTCLFLQQLYVTEFCHV